MKNIEVPRFITIEVPTLGVPNRVEAIKAIRTLTGLGLKEAKDVQDKSGEHQLEMISGLSRPVFDEQVSILKRNNIIARGAVGVILEELRDMAKDALQMGEDELANEILQLVLVEKFRRATP